MCNAGYIQTGSIGCEDINECTDGTNLCRKPASCVNTDGSYLCTCPEFLVSNGTVCVATHARIEILGYIIMQILVRSVDARPYSDALASSLNISSSSIQFSFVQFFDINGTAEFRDFDAFDAYLSMSFQGNLFFRAFIFLNASMILDHDFTDLKLFNSILANEVQQRDLDSMLILQYLDRHNMRCGDKIISFGETCDDGNLENNDGCSELCQVESGWICVYQQNNRSECSDINECQDGVQCSHLSRCTNTIGSYVCSCLFNTLDVYGDGTLCEETSKSLANNTAYSYFADVIPGNITASFVQGLAIYENSLIISRYGMVESHTAEIYQKNGYGPWPTIPSARLLAARNVACSSDGRFGVSLAITAEFAVVGSSKGCVLIYHRDSIGHIWISNSAAVLSRDDQFYGTAVAAVGSSVLIGAYGAGKVFLYTRNSNLSWPLDPKLIFQERSHSLFGHSLKMTATQIFVTERGQGYIYIFARNDSGTWPNSATYTLQVPFSNGAGAVFGPSLSATDNYVFVGDPGQKTVFIFSRLANGTWPSLPSKKLFNAEDLFGSCIASTDIFAVISAYESNSVYIYRVSANGTWLDPAIQRITESNVAARFLGHTCAITNFHVVLGSYQVSHYKIYFEMHSCGVICCVCLVTAGCKHVHSLSKLLLEYVWMVH